MAASLFTAAHGELVSTVVAMRKKAKMTQRDLAEAVGREQNYIARIETGQRRVDLIEFVIICRACGAEAGTETANLVKKIGEMLPRRRKSS
jgi:transcriptional regulator with XRE-family HTH domain